MDIKKFIGKVVIEKESGKRFILKEITSPYIAVKEENNINAGISIVYDTINGDPIKRGVLEFEDKTLTAQFLATIIISSHRLMLMLVLYFIISCFPRT